MGTPQTIQMFRRLVRPGLPPPVARCIRRFGSGYVPKTTAFNPGRLQDASISSSRKVLIIYTGGTLGMDRINPLSEELNCVPGYLTEQIHNTVKIQKSLPECDVIEWDELLDSSNVEPQDWAYLAKQVGDAYLDYDGFVILHGTDTMAYTASALSFMLRNLGKPVVFTGSQIPFCDAHNDARRNVLASILVAGNFDIPEVCLFFNDTLLRGNRSTKQATSHLDAFHSPNFPSLGELKIDFSLNSELIESQPRGRLQCHTSLSTGITVLRLVPGFDDCTIERVLESKNTDGKRSALVLMLYGTGGAPERKASLYAAIKKASEAGTIVVVCSQCTYGSVDLGKYAVSNALRDSGVLGAGDMTVEAIVGKLAYLLGREDLSIEQVRMAFEEDLRGERGEASRLTSRNTSLINML